MSETASKSAIILAFVHYVAKKGKKPSTIAAFCEKSEIESADFYKFFNSFDAVENAFFEHLLHETLTGLQADETYTGYSVREKLLAFFFAFIEKATPHRGYFLVTTQRPNLKEVSKFKKFHEALRTYFNDLTHEAIDSGEISNRFQLHKIYADAAILQFSGIFYFWCKDQTEQYTATDELIEKSVNWVMDVVGRNGIDSGLELARFIFRNPMR